MMKRKTMILSTILCLLPILLGLYLYDQLPDMVPTHFNAGWEPDGWSSKPMAVFGFPCLIAGINLLCHWGMGMAQKQDDRKVAPDVLLNLCYWIPGAISVVMMPLILLEAVGIHTPMETILYAILGITFLVVGNYLPKCKMNPYIGIKLPWTYSSDENWRKTHRLGGFVWVVAGLLLLVNILLNSVAIQLLAMIGAVLIPGVYSYVLYRKEKK